MDTSADQPFVPKAETGEEAYLRRLQMSQGIIRAPVPAVPTFVQPKPPPAENPTSMPLFVSAQGLAKDDVSPEATAAASFTPLTQDAIEERKKAAAAVAARLAALTKSQLAPPSEATQA
jgi:splicing factor 45